MVELQKKSAKEPLVERDLGSPLRILVVDDNQDSAHTLARLLNVLGLNAVAAYSGTSAIQEIERCRPALAFLDLRMPGMDGIETATRIRQSPGGSEVILIALSGLNEIEESNGIREAGFSTHLSKPLNISTLEKTLAEFVGYQVQAISPAPK